MKKKRGRPKNSVWVDGKGYTENTLKEKVWSDLRKTHVTKSYIVKNKILTKSKLEKAIKDGYIHVTKLGRNHFVKKDEVKTFLKATQLSLPNFF